MAGDGAAPAFIILALVWFLVYPSWTRYRYKKHYRNFVKEQFKDYDNRSVSLQIEDEYIYAKDEGSESKTSLTEIQEISEIPSLFLVKIKPAQSLIIAKRNIDNEQDIKLKLQSLAKSLNVPFNNHLDWKWK
ncbi:YcxB family protein [Arcticibacter tournemirensis]|uniref:YcxB family protein n=1 Tax=Arcticibacter tournemirensis TaxID=699437 RepID=A0A4Q0M421_9SPHI|nr:YcxB family protein [Arcticibacter tournemirensis]RXF67439.1 YcxB family protein [Arcticibacter tournemirensis]